MHPPPPQQNKGVFIHLPIMSLGANQAPGAMAGPSLGGGGVQQGTLGPLPEPLWGHRA